MKETSLNRRGGRWNVKQNVNFTKNFESLENRRRPWQYYVLSFTLSDECFNLYTKNTWSNVDRTPGKKKKTICFGSLACNRCLRNNTVTFVYATKRNIIVKIEDNNTKYEQIYYRRKPKCEGSLIIYSRSHRGCHIRLTILYYTKALQIQNPAALIVYA